MRLTFSETLSIHNEGAERLQSTSADQLEQENIAEEIYVVGSTAHLIQHIYHSQGRENTRGSCISSS